MMKKITLQIIVVFVCSFSLIAFTSVAHAVDSLGGVAGNLLTPVNFFSNLISTACFVIGGSFLFASLIKYFEHKRSPLMTTMSTVVFLFIAGLVLVLLPFLSYYVNGSSNIS